MLLSHAPRCPTLENALVNSQIPSLDFELRNFLVYDAINLTYRRNSTGRRPSCLKLPSVCDHSHLRLYDSRTDQFAAGVRQNVAELLEYSNETKKRNFLETVE